MTAPSPPWRSALRRAKGAVDFLSQTEGAIGWFAGPCLQIRHAYLLVRNRWMLIRHACPLIPDLTYFR